MIPPFTHSNTAHRGSILTTYPTDSSAPVFSVICSQNFKEDVGVGSVVCELQETGEATHSELKRGNGHLGLIIDFINIIVG